MNITLACVLSAGVVLAGGAGISGASGQDRTQTPGEPTKGKVWIENRGASEAIPVSIQNAGSDAPSLRVELTGVPIVTIGSGSVVQALVARQAWEYRDVSIDSGQDPEPLLNAAGAEGWETSGVAFVRQGATIVVMKRPR